MSRRDNMKRIFVGNLPPDVRTRDLEDLFYKFGKIAFIDLKTRRGPPFAFVEFHDYRDAEEAVRCRDGKDWDGCRLRVEFPRGRERTSRFKSTSGSSRSSAPQRRSKFRVKVSGLPSSGSWQDLKDHMREVGEVCFADVYKGGEGVVEFVTYDDMRHAIRKLNNTKFKSHEGESSYIKLREDFPSGDSRSRSTSPVTRRRRGSPSYSPVTKRRDSHSPSRSPSRSPKPRRGAHHKRSSRRGRSNSRSRSVSRSRSHSRSPSGSPRSARGSSRGSRDRSRSRSKSNSRSPRYDKSPARSDKRSRSISRSPSPVSKHPKRSSSRDNNNKNSRSRSRSKSTSRSNSRSPVDSKRTHSKTPSRTPTPDPRNGSPVDVKKEYE